jgi:hypothetical protein
MLEWDFHLFGSSYFPIQDFFHICLENLKLSQFGTANSNRYLIE